MNEKKEMIGTLSENRRQFLKKFLRGALVAGAAIYTVELKALADAGAPGGSVVTTPGGPVTEAPPSGPTR